MAAEAVTRVVLRCEKAQEDRNLDLSSCLLESVPQAVYHLMRKTQLSSIDLSHNALTIMSKKLPMKFPSVTAFNISDNKVEKIPDEIKEMTMLETLNASHNQLSTLPETFYELSSLRILDLSHNDITDLDASKLCRMSGISEINLEDNPIPGDICTELSQHSQECNLKLLISEPPSSDHMD
ncbi:leucine-rich repeat protein SHOC-2-like [Lytechinus pictus]|uniref:leucine-rich repeat protein SHOC-2-like n=1 Tax=Lytechinus pictus TaxID=7653 RepID=UPI0030B9FED6